MYKKVYIFGCSSFALFLGCRSQKKKKQLRTFFLGSIMCGKKNENAVGTYAKKKGARDLQQK